MEGAVSPFPQYAFMAWCSVKKCTGTTLPLPLPLPFTLSAYPPTQLVLGVLSPRMGREADHSPPPSTEVKNALCYAFTSLIRLHGVVIN
jgi:hypothetical protein